MHTPQIIYIVLQVLGLGLSMAKHGQPQKPYDFWISLTASVIMLSLLIWGGFFNQE